MRASLSMGTPFLSGETRYQEGGSYTEDFDRRMKEGCSGGASLCEGSIKGTLREGPFTGEPERSGVF